MQIGVTFFRRTRKKPYQIFSAVFLFLFANDKK